MLTPAANAEVLRCADDAGQVSYTNDACPLGTRLVRRVDLLQAPELTPAEVEAQRQALADRDQRSSRVLRESEESVARQLKLNRGNTSAGDVRDPRGATSRQQQDGADPVLVPLEPSYFPDPRFSAAPRYRPPRDQRPRLRQCDVAGCSDTLGNHYDRAGQIDRYQSIDGRTCRQVGSTTVCR
ncbi:MAG: DUF4124 domain-containing protein [Variovorax sp.]